VGHGENALPGVAASPTAVPAAGTYNPTGLGPTYRSRAAAHGPALNLLKRLSRRSSGAATPERAPPGTRRTELFSDEKATEIELGGGGSAASGGGGWTVHTSKATRAYYHNEATDESRWTKPDELQMQAPAQVKPADNEVQVAQALAKAKPLEASVEAVAESFTKPAAEVVQVEAKATAEMVEAAVEVTTQVMEAAVDVAAEAPSPSTAMEASSSASDGGGWTAHTTNNGRAYYYNQATGASRWSKPDEVQQPPLPVPVEDAWTEHRTAQGEAYYYNQSTGESRWTRPVH